jgi:hypothetical protein
MFKLLKPACKKIYPYPYTRSSPTWEWSRLKKGIRQVRWLNRLFITEAALVFLLITVLFLLHLSDPKLWPSNSVDLGTMVSLLMLSATRYPCEVNAKKLKALLCLCLEDQVERIDIGVLGCLIESIELVFFWDREELTQIETGLAKVFTRLAREEYELLTPYQQRCLQHSLRGKRSSEYTQRLSELLKRVNERNIAFDDRSADGEIPNRVS